MRDSMFDKGQSKRIWGELYKVLDSSDVIVEVSSTTSAHHRPQHLCLMSAVSAAGTQIMLPLMVANDKLLTMAQKV